MLRIKIKREKSSNQLPESFITALENAKAERILRYKEPRMNWVPTAGTGSYFNTLRALFHFIFTAINNLMRWIWLFPPTQGSETSRHWLKVAE